MLPFLFGVLVLRFGVLRLRAGRSPGTPPRAQHSCDESRAAMPPKRAETTAERLDRLRWEANDSSLREQVRGMGLA